MSGRAFHRLRIRDGVGLAPGGDRSRRSPDSGDVLEIERPGNLGNLIINGKRGPGFGQAVRGRSRLGHGCLSPNVLTVPGKPEGHIHPEKGADTMSAKVEKIVRDQLEERVMAGSLRTETDPKRLVGLLDDRIDLDLKDLRAGPPRALDYANVIDALLARAELEGISHQEIEATRVARIAARGRFRAGG